ncbi:MAG: Phosphogluconate dehydratase (EC [uncultured Thiotrichaceae bacterium]|uniref:Phosphogluconate dehydratase n=1 Tax=uncultured Thiotrichaceae bacterium TaxID=298394 RepID=A0A6S6UJM1_9GAMM|nr:MAG: Phosphogluconate dehydratase (EC [uncultured Thiotrichaceae bacterium]
MHKQIQTVTDAIIERSKPYREIYLQRIDAAQQTGVNRQVLGCSNLAHGFAACPASEKALLADTKAANIAIVSAYNDMLSAHQPLAVYPAIIKDECQQQGVTAQFAGGVPAMCDGVTQSQPGMELSLFSRDVIAQATAIALSHNMFDGALYLGVCDKIVPGLLMGALSFGHLPAAFIPAGPMRSGVSNSEKAQVRQAFAQGKVDEKELLRVEAGSYHSPGTCTFYGTANSNQMLMEIMGLHLPGSSFVNANTPLRDALTRYATQQVIKLTDTQGEYLPIGKMLDEKSFVNAIIGLLATGGSSNHTLHIIAMARVAGIVINWSDFHALSRCIPLLTRLYPNGSADVNHFHQQGGMPVVIKALLSEGLLHENVQTIMGKGLKKYCHLPQLIDDELVWYEATDLAKDNGVISPASKPFDTQGGLNILDGNIGRSVIKSSALKPEHRRIEAEARVFDSQEALQQAYQEGELNRDFVAVVRFQGPKANGMPELHGLLPAMGSLQDAGYQVAIITDGRMSGASGKVASAIHMTPEALAEGVIGKIQNGDMIRLDVDEGRVELLVADEIIAQRETAESHLSANEFGMGRELFAPMRRSVSSAEDGATIFTLPGAAL